ncbi:thiosulfate sulfurtransferase [Candidatus Fermentibacteria bacterium]|nr:thiosulfate sulfurtransferase [Candidatus Fermentibacteria bacterium]
MAGGFANITTEDLLTLLDLNDPTVIDARSVDAYNGWRLRDEPRGGHIKGARSLWYRWVGKAYWDDLIRKKEIDTKGRVVVYGYDREQSTRVASALHEAGCKDLQIYDDFVDGWSANPEPPMERLARFDQLVHPGWLDRLIKGGKPEQYDGRPFAVCHAHYRNPRDYNIGHIPGAIPMDTLELEEPRMWNRRSPEELKSNLERKGITHDTMVITYGRFSSPDNRDPFPGSNAGQIAAARCAAIMMYAGVEDVRVLNGGLMSWEAAGLETTDRPAIPSEVDDFGTDVPARRDLMVDLTEAGEILASKEGELVSIRSWQEFIGEVSGYNYIDIKGRIPGAVFGDCGSDAYHMENFRNPDHTTREYGEIARNWEESGIIPDKRIAFYCGTGWRASEAFLNAYLMGWDNISVFDGGWMAWSNDPANPIQTGIPD